MLYELLGAAPPTGAPSARSAPGAGDATRASPRQSVRVPIGWFWLSAVAALAMVAVAYQFGRSSGERAGFARGQEYSNDGALQARMAGETPDPTRRGGATPPVAPPPPGAAPKTASGSGAGGDRPATAPPGTVAPPAATGDPREKGRNYLVIARPAATEAQKLADFLRSNQLEVAVVPDDNPRFRKVVALPGFPAGTARSSEQVRRLESKVKSLGQTWKNAARGNRDFDDAYLELNR